MKCLTKINGLFYFILFLGFFHLSSNAQTFLNKHYLSDDVENLINSNPDQALKIAQYLLSKTNTSNSEKAKVNYLISKSYLVKGDYSSALNFLYEEKNYEDYLSDLQKIDIQICIVTLLRELSLDKQAKRILKQLEVTSKTISDDKLKSYLEASVNIQNAKFLSKENKNKEGIDLIENQAATKKDFLLEYRELQLNQIITLGQLFLNQNDLEKSKEQFENALTIINELNDENIFTKIDALQGMASIAFLKKDHKQVLILLDEALVYAKKLNNLFLQVSITQKLSASYLALQDIPNYKSVNMLFFELQTETEAQEQEAINTAYNLISDEYTEEYSSDKTNNINILYIVSGLFFIALLISLFFWQKLLERKKGLDEIMTYIEITRSNLLSSFTVADKKQEPKKNIILKETEEQILNKLKRFESSKRFINKDISLAVLAGQLDSNTKYLSEIINTHYNVNFNTYINKLRINYIIEKLKTDPNFINYKISYLADNCGFSSHSSFATVFKSITGISPVKFIELLNQEKENNLLE
jgi:AraC-like DNA-binding protein